MVNKKTNNSNNNDNLKAISLIGNMVLEFSSGVLLGILIGWGLDKLLNTKPLFIIIFLCFGFGAGFLNLYRYLKNKL